VLQVNQSANVLNRKSISSNTTHSHSSNLIQTEMRSSSSFEPVLSIPCLAAQDLGERVEQPFNCFIISNRQVVQSMGRAMDWTFEGNKVDRLFRIAMIQTYAWLMMQCTWLMIAMTQACTYLENRYVQVWIIAKWRK